MKLSDLDRREVCGAHGWVGRNAFQRDRHDLCEAPAEESVAPLDEETDVDEEEDDDEDEHAREKEDEDQEPPRWSRAAARQRGIPPKKTVAVRRITQIELAAGRAELQVLGANDPYDRPRTRGDCQWCPVCQLVRDGKSDGSDREARRALRGKDDHDDRAAVPVRRRNGKKEVGDDLAPYVARPLACGHAIGEVIYRSRPCVFVGCSQSLYLDISETGSIIFNFPHLEPGQMPADQSCALDLSDRGGMTLEEIAVVTNLTRERIRQVELRALIRRARPAALALGLGAEDAIAAGSRRSVGPGADLVETGVDGELPSDVATILASSTNTSSK